MDFKVAPRICCSALLFRSFVLLFLWLGRMNRCVQPCAVFLVARIIGGHGRKNNVNSWQTATALHTVAQVAGRTVRGRHHLLQERHGTLVGAAHMRFKVQRLLIRIRPAAESTAHGELAGREDPLRQRR
jgi:hypothetical protein